ELRDQIRNLKSSLASAEAKLLALYGNTEHDFDLGNDGENAAKGSYIRILYDKLKYKEEQFAAKRIELNKVARELEEKKDELAEKEADIEAKEAEIRTLNQEIRSKSQEISHLNDQIREKDAEIERLREENERYRIDYTDNSQELTRLRNENSQKQARIEELERENTRLKSTITTVEFDRDQALNDSTYWWHKYNEAISNPSGGDSSAEELRESSDFSTAFAKYFLLF
ncbi:hypothetical protein C4M96_04175, partial [Mycoplasmopsis pullorum]|uniref:hypothetical protein n=1 Tax=Mycoplasmopsis pullorum TaxID=48003 RepID=UPI0015D65C0C